MQIGIVGIGRMGANMARRLLSAGQEPVVYDRNAEKVDGLVAEGINGAHSLPALIERLDQPRAIWLMVPAAVVDETLQTLVPLLATGDIVIDGGNSYYRDDIRRACKLRAEGIAHVDVGTSGGVWGRERGYCLMVGGDEDVVRHLDPVFAALAPGQDAAPLTPGRHSTSTAEQGYLHCGGHGAGHFVKMVHNGIEYGVMAAYAEGFNILRRANVGADPRSNDAETAPLRDPDDYRYRLDLPDIADLWRRGSVIGSWLLDLTAAALANGSELDGYTGRVSDSGEGRWTVAAAIDEGVPAPVLSAALFERFSSRGDADYADKLLSAMRFEFGGHVERHVAGL